MTAAVALFLLGLFPAFFLPVLQVILLIVLGELIWQTRLVTRGALRAVLSWPNVAFWQFAGFFLINAGVFAAMEGTPAGSARWQWRPGRASCWPRSR